MKIYYIITVLLYLCALQITAQTNPIEWIRYDNTDSDESIIRLDSMGNVIVCGETYNPGPVIGTQTMKYDANGQVLWKKQYDTFAQDRFVDCETTADGSVYTLLNSVDYLTQTSRFILFKYLSDGTVDWQYSYGDTLPIGNHGISLFTDESGNIYIAGTVQYFATNEGGLLLLKINPSGELLWEAYYAGYGALNARLNNDIVYVWGTGQGNKFFCWQVSTEGQSLAAYDTETYSAYYGDNHYIDGSGNFYVGSECCEYRITKFSPKGEKKWEYIKPVTASDPPTVQARLSTIITDEGNNVYVSGPFYENPTVSMICLITKLNESGNVIWERSMSAEGFKFLAPASTFIDENEIYITGSMTRTVGDNLYEPFILQYDFDGNLTRKLFLDLDQEKNTPRSIICDHGICFLTVVSFSSILTEDTRQATVKINATSSTKNEVDPAKTLELFPNPGFGKTTLVLKGWNAAQAGLLQVYDLQGREVYRTRLEAGQTNDSITIDLDKALAAGTYQILVENAGQRWAGKCVKM